MELGKLRDLLELLQASGVTSYKDSSLELQLGAAPVSKEAGQEDTQTEKASVLDKELSTLPEGYRKMFTTVSLDTKRVSVPPRRGGKLRSPQ